MLRRKILQTLKLFAESCRERGYGRLHPTNEPAAVDAGIRDLRWRSWRLRAFRIVDSSPFARKERKRRPAER